MKCQHCGSTDLVKIKSQSYCLACGYAVNERVTKSAMPSSGAKSIGRSSPKSLKGMSIGAKPTKSDEVGQLEQPNVQPAQPIQHRASKEDALWASKAHPARFTLEVAASWAFAVAALTGLVLIFNLDSDIGLLTLGAGIVALVVGAVLAQSALLYGVARYDNGRAAPRKYWWGVARNGFMDVINVDLIAFIVVAAATLVSVALWQIGAEGSLGVAKIVLVVVLNLALCLLILGAYISRRIAVAAVVIGGVSASEATKIGWRLYLKAGGHLGLTAIKGLLGRLAVAAMVAVGVYGIAQRIAFMPNQSQVVVIGASAILAALGAFLFILTLLEWETRLWLKSYRQGVTSFTPAERVRLLTGRPPLVP